MALRVAGRLDGVEEAEAPEAVDIDLVVENGDDKVPPQPHGLDGAAEAELRYDARVPVVPQHDLVRLEARPLAAPSEGQDVGPEQHRHDAEATAILKVAAVSQ